MRIHSWLNCIVVLVFGLTPFVHCASPSCSKPTLENGRVRIRGRGKMVYFRCRKRFERVGARFAICLPSGQWTQETPICVSRGCPDLGELPNLLVKELYNGGMVKFECQPGMSRKGPEQLTCDGKKWSEPPPTCVVGASLQCDFETDTLCGWSQETEDDFDWTWFSGATPTLNTGPKFDHTLGEGKDGHYLFIEASSPRSSGHKASLKSPVFQPDLGQSCFQFWYHMMGPDSSGAVGQIEVYSQPESASLDMLSPLWSLEGNQGDQWHVAVVKIPPQDENFQIIILGTRLDGYVSDLAIDDVILMNCTDVTTPKAEETTTPMTTTPPTTPQTTPQTTPTTTTAATTTPVTTTSKPTKSTRFPGTASTTTKTTTPKSTTAATATTTKSTTSATSPSTTAPTTTPMTTTTMTTTTITWSTPTAPTTMTASTMTPSTTTPSTTAMTTTELTTVTEPSTVMTTPSTVTTTPSTSESSPTTTAPSTTVSTYETSLPTDKITDVTEAATTTPQVDTSSVTDSPEVTSAGAMTDDGSGEVPVVTDSPDNTDVITADYNEIPVYTPTANSTSNDTSNEIPNFSGTAKQKDYHLPMIIGLSAGIAVGVIIIAVLATLWTRNQRKKKQQAEEDEISMINSLEGNLFNHN